MFESLVNAIKNLVLGEFTLESVKQALADAAAKRPSENLEPNGSIVDTMKTLYLESSLEGRQDLAIDIGFLGPVDGSAASNTALLAAFMEALQNRYIPK